MPDPRPPLDELERRADVQALPCREDKAMTADPRIAPLAAVLHPYTCFGKHTPDEEPKPPWCHKVAAANIEADAVAAERARISGSLRALHERLANDAKPKRKRCECGLDIDAHAGGWVLLHHDFFIVDRLADAIIEGETP